MSSARNDINPSNAVVQENLVVNKALYSSDSYVKQANSLSTSTDVLAANTISFPNLLTFANNAAALAADPPLVPGDVYRTAAGALMVVYDA